MLLGLILTLLLITACTLTEKPISNENEAENDQLPLPNQISEITEKIPTIIKEATQTYSPEVTELIEKSANLKSYHYALTVTKRNQYRSYETVENYQAEVKDSKIKKSFPVPLDLNKNIYYSEIYLDTKKETALATCDLKTVLCDDNRLKIYSLSYPDVKINIKPLDIIKNIPKDAKQVGTERIDNRQAAILEYTNAEGNKERLSLDTYSGFPLKQESFILENDEEIMSQKNVFNIKGLNNVKNSGINLPENYEIVE